MKFAVIDIGTNSIHMLIAEILPNFSFEVIGREKEMIRLGDGTLSTGYLSKAKMEEGIETVKKFKYLAQSKGVQKFQAVATSAVREAHNGGDFLKRIYKTTGITVRIITGEEEGRLIYLGVKNSMHLKEENTLLIDIGGGSVELMVVNPQEILFLQSFKIGAARLTDRFLKKFSEKEFAKLEEFVEEQIEEAASSILHLGYSDVIGTAGTINNLATMASYEKNAVPLSALRNPRITDGDLKKLYDRLRDSTPEERLEMKGLDPRRSDIILGGTAVLTVLMRMLNIDAVIACDKAIREGMIYNYIQKNRTRIRSEAEIPDVRRRSVLKLAHKCDYGKEHAEQVSKLALQIFDKSETLHGLSPLDRELLEYSALLHDIGYHISFENHHRHADYLIRNAAMNGFSQDEILIMALVARYHRRADPKKNYRRYKNLGKMVRRRIQWLSAILKVADALDRSHFSVVECVKIRTYEDKVVFQVETGGDAEYEVWEANHKCRLFQRLAGREVLFKPKRVSSRKSLRSRPKVSRLTRTKRVIHAV